jgi:aminopeptidase N
MKHSFAPDTFDLDLTGAMAMQLRVARMSFAGSIDNVEERAFNILWRNPSARGGYSYDEIKPRLSTAIDLARRLGPIDLDAEVADS